MVPLGAARKDCRPILLHSILKHNSCQITMYVMYTELTEQEILQFQEDANQSGHAEIVFLKIGEEQFSDVPLHFKWITKETYYRLLAQELMPEGMERFLDLDVDMVVLDSVEEFYHQDFGGKLLVACNAKKAGEIAPKILEQRTLPPDTVYFNAGTLLYNLKAQREVIDPQILHEYPKLFYDRLSFGDQDVLNAVFYRQVKYADYQRFNLFDYSIEAVEDRNQAEARAVIFHFNGKGKPWTYQYLGLCWDFFWRYAMDFPEYAVLYPGIRLAQQQYDANWIKCEEEKKREKERTEEGENAGKRRIFTAQGRCTVYRCTYW